MVAKKAPSTKNKKDAALEALRESGKTYRSIFEHSSVPTIIIEKDSTISLTNNKFAEMSGFRRTDIDGKRNEGPQANIQLRPLACHVQQILERLHLDNRGEAEAYSAAERVGGVTVTGDKVRGKRRA